MFSNRVSRHDHHHGGRGHDFHDHGQDVHVHIHHHDQGHDRHHNGHRFDGREGFRRSRQQWPNPVHESIHALRSALAVSPDQWTESEATRVSDIINQAVAAISNGRPVEPTSGPEEPDRV